MKTVFLLASLTAIALAAMPITPRAHTSRQVVGKPPSPQDWAHSYVKSAEGWNMVPNANTISAWNKHMNANVRNQPEATYHVLKATDNGNVQTHAGFTVQDDPHNPGHDAQLARTYEQLLANNSRIVHSLQTLYATALWNNCNTYLDALRAGNLTLLDSLIAPIVNPRAQGRIHPLGYFDSSEGLVEYFMLACFPTPTTSQVVKETWTEITAFNNIVHFNIDFCFQIPPYNASEPCRNLTHVGWARADDQGRIVAIKILFQRLGITDLVIPPLANAQQQAVVTGTQSATVNGICGLVQSRCTGANQQYNTTADCVAYYSSINWGGSERADQRDLGCVSIHTVLTQSRPQIHCYHVGPNGGSPATEFPCINHGSDWFYQTDDILYNL